MLNSKSPRIGVTGPDTGGTAAWIFTALGILLSGGIPVRITPSSPKKIQKIQGLILGGGADVDPDTYEQEHFIQDYLSESFLDKRLSFFKKFTIFLRRLSYPVIYFIRKLSSRKSHLLDKERDHLEFNLLDKAIKNNIPVLGICRGAQLINIYFQGTLHKDIEAFYLEEINKFSALPVKEILLKENSKLSQIFKQTHLKVNALHHQAVNEPGEGLEIIGRESNGVVQAIESTLYDFVIGVQWHPEYLIRKNIHRRIFKALVNAANKKLIIDVKLSVKKG